MLALHKADPSEIPGISKVPQAMPGVTPEEQWVFPMKNNQNKKGKKTASETRNEVTEEETEARRSKNTASLEKKGSSGSGLQRQRKE